MVPRAGILVYRCLPCGCCLLRVLCAVPLQRWLALLQSLLHLCRAAAAAAGVAAVVLLPLLLLLQLLLRLLPLMLLPRLLLLLTPLLLQ